MHPYHQKGERLSPVDAQRLRVLVARHGSLACAVLGIGAVSLDKVIGGGSAAPKTIARIVKALDEAA